jgi:hypothetical protein
MIDEESSSSTTSTVDEEDDNSTTSTTTTSTSSLEDINTKFLREQYVESDKNRMQFSLFQKGDGSADDPDGLPTRYLVMQNHKRSAAQKALQATLDWRMQHSIDQILIQPRPNFNLCKQVFPHAFLARDPEGHVVFLQRPALIDMDLGKRNKLTNEALLEHYVYVNEYLWQIVEGDNNNNNNENNSQYHALSTMTSILDLTGLNFKVLKQRELVNFLKKFVLTMDSHYPIRAHKTLIVNTPKWFNVFYKVVSPILRESTKSKIEILSKGKRQDEALKRCVGVKNKHLLPINLWSKKESKKGARSSSSETTETDAVSQQQEELPLLSQLEQDLQSYTSARLKEAGVKMQAIR